MSISLLKWKLNFIKIGRSTMKIGIDKRILLKYPNLEIGYLVANVAVKPSDPYIDQLKTSLFQSLEARGIDNTNFTAHKSIACWRDFYREEFKVKPKSYRSSVESLVKRIATNKGMFNINSIVDLYNSISVLTLLPMGGYDLKKVNSEISIRYAEDGEEFHGIGEKEEIYTKSNHIVYSDKEKTLCWLLNYKDSKYSCIDESTEKVIFFIDSLETNRVGSAIAKLSESLSTLKFETLQSGMLNSQKSIAYVGVLCS